MDIIPRGNTLLLSGSQKKITGALNFFSKLEENFRLRPDKENVEFADIQYMIGINEKKQVKDLVGDKINPLWKPSEKVFTTYRGKTIFPRTYNQEIFYNSLNENMITFAIGPAGTGKTFLSIATACKMLQTGEVERLVLTRPAVEAGESLGFLPGDLSQKVDPYLRPIYDALYECIGYEKVQELLSTGKIEIAPIAFMRGRTLANSFILLDEAQNCTINQLKMILTRLGRNSRMSLSGDITQIDLEYGKSGLDRVVSLFQDTEGIGLVIFGKEDITRHPLVEKIVRKFEELK
ncbi:MAG: PhoH family protein [Leptospiraceae bacterium]|nr:PhoH family protein [Leptospiraceae bacterium]MCK6380910.1 PhoH family protein [Leptospiraceae bacterium]NUM40034.1 PhoH family protein [Leptospiraceae bacterium]